MSRKNAMYAIGFGLLLLFFVLAYVNLQQTNDAIRQQTSAEIDARRETIAYEVQLTGQP